MSLPATTEAPRPLDDYERLPDAELDARIRAAKKALGSRLVILGHHYQRESVIEFADFRGDSFKLVAARGAPRRRPSSSCSAASTSWRSRADVLRRPHQSVILPDLKAGCSMADMADIEDVEEAWDALTRATATRSCRSPT